MAKTDNRFGTGIYIGLGALVIAVSVVLVSIVLSHHNETTPIPDNIISITDSTDRNAHVRRDTNQSTIQNNSKIRRKRARSPKRARPESNPVSRNYLLSPEDE